MIQLPGLCWLLLSSLLLSTPAFARDRSLEVQKLQGKQIWYGNGCYRCHTTFPRAIKPVVERFRVAHDPVGRDYLPGSIDQNMLRGYQRRLSETTIFQAVKWADSVASLYDRGDPFK